MEALHLAQLEFCNALIRLWSVYADPDDTLSPATRRARMDNARNRMRAAWWALDSHSFRGWSVEVRPWAGLGRSFLEALNWYLAMDVPAQDDMARAPLTLLLNDLGESAARFYLMQRQKFLTSDTEEGGA